MGSPYVPTKSKDIKAILDPADIKKNQTFIELGSGDGRIARFAAREYGVRAEGIDINPLLVFWSNYLAKMERLGNKAVFKRVNIFKYNLSKADCVYIFLMPELIKKLESKLKKELKKGAMVISHGFKIEGLKKRLVKEVKRVPFPTYYYKI